MFVECRTASPERRYLNGIGVSPAAICAHFEGGLSGLEAAMVYEILRDVARPYGPNDTPAGYVRHRFVRLPTGVHRKQPLEQLIVLELSADALVCPVFVERLFATALGSGKVAPDPARALDVVLAMPLGMIMVASEGASADAIRFLAILRLVFTARSAGDLL